MSSIKSKLTKTYNILHVDDESDILDLIKYSIQKMDSNLCIDSVLSPQEALHAIQTKKYDMVITDYLMPETSGLELLAQVRQKQVEIPFIMLTGHSREEIVIQSLNAGIDYYLEKGPTLEAMSLELHHFINKIRAQQEIQERHEQAERALQNQTNLLNALIHSSQDGILAYDTEHHYTVWNSAMEKISGFSSEAVIGHQAFELFPFLEEVGEAQALRSAIKGKPMTLYDMPFVIPNSNKTLFFDSSHFPLFDSEGTIIGGMAIIRDISQRKKEQEQLQHSEEKYRVLFETAPIGIGIAKWDGQILDTNQYMYQLTGYSADEFASLNAADLYEDISQRGRLIQLLRKAGSVRDFEAQMKKKDGSLFTALLNVNLIKSDGQTRTLAIIRDITEQRQIETQLRVNETRTQAILALIPDLIFHSDKDGRLLSFTGNTADLYVPAETFLGKTIIEILPKDVAQKIMHYHQKALETGELQTYEYELKIDNKISQFEGRMVPTIEKDQVLLIARNISDQKQARKKLLKQKQLFQTILDNSPAQIYAKNLDGQYILANKAIAKYLGVSQEQLIGKSNFDFFTHQTATQFRSHDKQVQAAMVPMQFEEEIEEQDKILTNLSIKFPLFTPEGTIYATGGISTDISVRKNTEVLLQKQKHELSDFTNTMVHDLRNYLTGIEDYAHLIGRTYQSQYLSKIKDRVHRIFRLLNKSIVLAEAGLIIDEKRLFALQPLLEEVIEVILPKSVKLQLNNLNTVKIKADREKLAQIFKNLFENAVLHGKSSLITVTAITKAESFSIQIKNDGIPISANIREQINSNQVKGLGLAIINKLVTAHGWIFSFDETHAVDTTSFKIQLPRSDIALISSSNSFE